MSRFFGVPPGFPYQGPLEDLWRRAEIPHNGPPHPWLPDLQLLDHVLQLLAATCAHHGLGVEVWALDPGQHLLGQEVLQVLEAQPIQQFLDLWSGTGSCRLTQAFPAGGKGPP
jgi:hypothetical protein